MRKTLVLSMTVVALLVAGCGGGNDKKADSEASSDSKESSSKESSSDDSSSDSSDDASTGNAEIDKALEDYKKADIKVTYREGDGDEWTLVQDGKGKGAYIQEDSATYFDGDSLTTCSGTGSEQECTTVKGSGSSFYGLGPFALWSSLSQSLKMIPGVKTSSDRVAGRDAKCVTYDPSAIAKSFGGNASGAGSTICVDAKTGVMLKLDDTSSPDNSIEAVSFGTSSAADLTPPKATTVTVPADAGRSPDEPGD